jgi:hypothetical protein
MNDLQRSVVHGRIAAALGMKLGVAQISVQFARRAMLWVTEYRTRKRMVEAKARSSSFLACKKFLIAR